MSRARRRRQGKGTGSAPVAPSAPLDVDSAANTISDSVVAGQPIGVTFRASVGSPPIVYASGPNNDARFSINASTGVAVYSGTGTIVPGNSYSVTCVATNSVGSSGETVLLVTATGSTTAPSTPVDTNAAANVLYSNAVAGDSVGVTFQSASGSPPITYAAGPSNNTRFSIHSSTGNVTYSGSGAIVDGTPYTASCIATNSAGSSVEATATVTGTLIPTAPNLPVDINASSNLLYDNAVTGDTVGVTFRSTIGTTPITYAAGPSNNSRFVVNSSTGIVTYSGTGAIVAGTNYTASCIATNSVGSSSEATATVVGASASDNPTIAGTVATYQDALVALAAKGGGGVMISNINLDWAHTLQATYGTPGFTPPVWGPSGMDGTEATQSVFTDWNSSALDLSDGKKMYNWGGGHNGCGYNVCMETDLVANTTRTAIACSVDTTFVSNSTYNTVGANPAIGSDMLIPADGPPSIHTYNQLTMYAATGTFYVLPNATTYPSGGNRFDRTNVWEANPTTHTRNGMSAGTFRKYVGFAEPGYVPTDYLTSVTNMHDLGDSRGFFMGYSTGWTTWNPQTNTWGGAWHDYSFGNILHETCYDAGRNCVWLVGINYLGPIYKINLTTFAFTKIRNTSYYGRDSYGSLAASYPVLFMRSGKLVIYTGRDVFNVWDPDTNSMRIWQAPSGPRRYSSEYSGHPDDFPYSSFFPIQKIRYIPDDDVFVGRCPRKSHEVWVFKLPSDSHFIDNPDTTLNTQVAGGGTITLTPNKAFEYSFDIYEDMDVDCSGVLIGTGVHDDAVFGANSDAKGIIYGYKGDYFGNTNNQQIGSELLTCTIRNFKSARDYRAGSGGEQSAIRIDGLSDVTVLNCDCSRVDMGMQNGNNLCVNYDNKVTSFQVSPNTVYYLRFKSQTGNFTAGQTLTEATYGATATIDAVIADYGTTGILQISNIHLGFGVYFFYQGIAISDPLGGAAIIEAPPNAKRWFLDFDNQTVNFTVGQMVHCSTSSGFYDHTAYIESVLVDSGSSGTLVLLAMQLSSGSTFYDDGDAFESATFGVVFTDPLGGSAKVAGSKYNLRGLTSGAQASLVAVNESGSTGTVVFASTSPVGFVDNETIKGSNPGEALVNGTWFGRNNWVATMGVIHDINVDGGFLGQEHGTYMGESNLAHFTDLVCWNVNNEGNMYKSRAMTTILTRCYALACDGGLESREIDIPNGGDLEIDGGVYEKNSRSVSSESISYSREFTGSSGGNPLRAMNHWGGNTPSKTVTIKNAPVFVNRFTGNAQAMLFRDGTDDGGTAVNYRPGTFDLQSNIILVGNWSLKNFPASVKVITSGASGSYNSGNVATNIARAKADGHFTAAATNLATIRAAGFTVPTQDWE